LEAKVILYRAISREVVGVATRYIAVSILGLRYGVLEVYAIVLYAGRGIADRAFELAYDIVDVGRVLAKWVPFLVLVYRGGVGSRVV